MTTRTHLLNSLVVLLFFLSACTTPPAQPASTNLPPLPTPDVPPLEAVDQAIQTWVRSGNKNYFFVVEERLRSGDRKISLIVEDGSVRAAQIQTKNGQDWNKPVSFPFDQAQNYTVDALLERIRADVLGQGPAPVNMKVVFDASMGFPTVVNAEALPSYSPAGSVLLNREYSYSLVTGINALVEDSFTSQGEPLLVLTRSNGPQAWCDILEIYPDGSSFYADDCQQISLPQKVPQKRWAELQTLLSKFALLEAVNQDDDAVQRLTITGTGQGDPDEAVRQETWNLALELQELLSYPLGAGVTLVYSQQNEIFGMDMLQQAIQPARVSIQGELYGTAISADEKWMAVSDLRGVRIINLEDGTPTQLLPASEAGGYYRPIAWNGYGRLLLVQVPVTDGELYQHGWASLDQQSWHPLPLPPESGSYGCDTGAVWSPDGSQIAIGGLGYGAACNLNPGLTIVDLTEDRAVRVVAQSIQNAQQEDQLLTAGVHQPAWSPDGEWIAFGMEEDAIASFQFSTRLYVVHVDGRGLAPISTNVRGTTSDPVWSPDGTLYYALKGDNTSINGIYRYDLATGDNLLLLPGENMRPLSISPDGNFLLYQQADQLSIWVFLKEENLPQTLQSTESTPLEVIGWITPPQE